MAFTAVVRAFAPNFLSFMGTRTQVSSFWQTRKEAATADMIVANFTLTRPPRGDKRQGLATGNPEVLALVYHGN